MSNSDSVDKAGCPFCQIVAKSDCREVLFANDLAVAFKDSYPVSEGHLLIIPKRHFPELFEATENEIMAIFRLLKQCQKFLVETLHPDGFNIGINVGKSAGQTVFHLHVHLIPRYSGDVSQPRGGVRHVIPGKGLY